MSNALLSLIRAASGDRATIRAEYIAAFSADLDEYVKANNKDSLTRAMQAIGKGEKWQALSAAIGAAIVATTATLPDNAGWIGAKNGSFAKADKEARTPYLMARAEGVDVFTSTLTASDQWRDITEADKAKQKAEKEAKKAEAEALAAEEKAKAVQGEVDARVASGELVRRESVRLLADYSVVALIGETERRENISAEDLHALAALVAKLQKHHAQPLAA